MTDTVTRLERARVALGTTRGENIRLRRQLGQARTELRHVRQAMSDRARREFPPDRIVVQAIDDAETLLHWGAMDQSISRRVCFERGMTESRWRYGLAVLELAGLWDMRRYRWTAPAPHGAEPWRILRAFAEDLKHNPKRGLRRLRAYMPRRFEGTGADPTREVAPATRQRAVMELREQGR